jgi:hypothetical protein
MFPDRPQSGEKSTENRVYHRDAENREFNHKIFLLPLRRSLFLHKEKHTGDRRFLTGSGGFGLETKPGY